MWRGALLLALGLLTFVAGLGRSAIVDTDEAYYAEAGREMVTGGDWITPHYNFETRLNKPVLYYWLVAGTYKILGVTETAARLWSALSGIGLSFVAYAVGRRWFSASTGLLAGAIVATSLGAVLLGRQSLPDMPLALCICVTIWAAIEAMSTRAVVATPNVLAAAETVRRRWVMLTGAAAGLGMLTKGPIALALPIMAVLPLVFWERRMARRRGGPARRFPITFGHLALAAGICVVIAAPWYIAVTRLHGAGFLRQFFIGENLERFTSDRFNEWRGPTFYLGVLATGLLPWTVFGVLWIKPVADILRRRELLTGGTARLCAWLVGPCVLLTVSAGSQPRYVVPSLVPVALLLARSILRETPESPARTRLMTVTAIAAGLLVAAIGVIVLRAKPLLIAGNPSWTPVGAFATIAAGVVVTGLALTQRRFVPAALVTAAATLVMTINFTVLTNPRPDAVERLAAAVRAQSPSTPVCACGGFPKNLVFYSHSPVVVGENEDSLRQFVEQSGERFAVVEAGRLASFEAAQARSLRRLAEVTHVPALYEKPAPALLDPNPARYVQRVFLVTTR